MAYFISFLEGVITFISPCILPMLPIYISYFAGQDINGDKNKTLKNSIGFVLGFSVIFIMLGAFASTIGESLKQHIVLINIISGIIVVIFGLNFLGILKISFLNKSRMIKLKTINLKFFSSLLFGIVFALGWTPCAGAFLGSALMLAASSADSIKGILMLVCYSLGLGIPFILSAVIINRLKVAFEFFKRNNRAITIISGSLLLIVGVLMMTGLMGKIFSVMTF